MHFEINPEDYMKEELVVDYYKFRDMPWVSKSKLLTWRMCNKLFKMTEIDKLETKSIDGIMEDKRDKGTNCHLVFSLFFKVVKKMDLVKRFMDVPVEVSSKSSFLYYAFYDICNQILPKSLRGDRDTQIIVSNFAEYQNLYWIYLREKFGNKREVFDMYWVPLHVEVYMENYEEMVYGTLDAVYRNPRYESNGKGRIANAKYVLVDYKTGNVPAEVRNGEGLPTEKMAELHFYAWLISIAHTLTGYEEIETLDEKFVKVKMKKPVYEKVFKDVTDFKQVLANEVFLGAEKPYFVDPRKPNDKSLGAVIRDIKALREMWKKNGPWSPPDNDYVCDNICSANSTCIDEEIKRAKYGPGGPGVGDFSSSTAL